MLLQSTTIADALADALAQYTYSELKHIMYVADRDYQAISGADALRLLANDPDLASENYQSEVFDCDDFAHMARAKSALAASKENLLHAYCVGILITDYHATNFTIDAQSNLHLVDFYYKETTAEEFQEFLPQLKFMGNPWLGEDTLRLLVL